MKRRIITVALLAMLTTAATSCQKENIMVSSIPAVQSDGTRMVCYVVDGNTHTAVINGDDNWREFLEYLTTLVEQGCRVVFWDGNRTLTIESAKETVTYTTKDREKALVWMDKMYNEGYQVSFTYDPTTGVYTCTAVR